MEGILRVMEARLEITTPKYECGLLFYQAGRFAIFAIEISEALCTDMAFKQLILKILFFFFNKYLISPLQYKKGHEFCNTTYKV